MNLSHTAQSGLSLHKIEGFNGTLNKYISGWQHKDSEGVQVGPFYPTKTEALNDTNDYAQRAGWMQA